MRTVNDFYIRSELARWMARNGNGALLLDVGCGTSPYLPMYQNCGATVVSCDVQVRGAATQVLADAVALPFSSGKFDLVVLSEVLEHVSSPDAVMGEISRILKPGGSMFLSTPLHYAVHELPFDFFRPTEFAIRGMCTAHGMEVTRLIRRGGLFSVLLTILLQVLFGASEMIARLPIIGAILRSTLLPLLERVFECGGYINFRCCSSNALTRPLDKTSGISRTLMLWTNGYCAIATKR